MKLLNVESDLVHISILICSTVLTFAAQLLLAALIKRLCFPRFTGRTPLWSYRFLVLNGFQIALITLHDTTMIWVQGTPFMAVWLRLLGGQIGEDVYYDTAVPGEMDNLSLGGKP